MGTKDRITLSGLRVYAHHGVFDFERVAGQDFMIDVTVFLDLSPAGLKDELATTVNYSELAEQVVAAVRDNPVQLIETVAERVAAVALANPLVLSTEVTVHKPQAPIMVLFEDVSVTIVRGQL